MKSLIIPRCFLRTLFIVWSTAFVLSDVAAVEPPSGFIAAWRFNDGATSTPESDGVAAAAMTFSPMSIYNKSRRGSYFRTVHVQDHPTAYQSGGWTFAKHPDQNPTESETEVNFSDGDFVVDQWLSWNAACDSYKQMRAEAVRLTVDSPHADSPTWFRVEVYLVNGDRFYLHEWQQAAQSGPQSVTVDFPDIDIDYLEFRLKALGGGDKSAEASNNIVVIDDIELLGLVIDHSNAIEISDIAYHVVPCDVLGDSQEEVLCGTYNNKVLCVDPRTRQTLWDYQLSAFPFDIVARDSTGDGKAETIVACADGAVVCLQTDGQVKWSYNGFRFGVLAVACVQAHGRDYVVAAGHDQRFDVLDATTGALLSSLNEHPDKIASIRLIEVVDLDGDGNEDFLANRDSAARAGTTFDAFRIEADHSLSLIWNEKNILNCNDKPVRFWTFTLGDFITEHAGNEIVIGEGFNETGGVSQSVNVFDLNGDPLYSTDGMETRSNYYYTKDYFATSYPLVADVLDEHAGHELLAICGGELRIHTRDATFYDPIMKKHKATVSLDSRLSFLDAKLFGRKLYLSSGPGGDRSMYVFDLDNPHWQQQFVGIRRQGIMRQAGENAIAISATLQDKPAALIDDRQYTMWVKGARSAGNQRVWADEVWSKYRHQDGSPLFRYVSMIQTGMGPEFPVSQVWAELNEHELYVDDKGQVGVPVYIGAGHAGRPKWWKADGSGMIEDTQVAIDYFKTAAPTMLAGFNSGEDDLEDASKNVRARGINNVPLEFYKPILSRARDDGMDFIMHEKKTFWLELMGEIDYFDALIGEGRGQALMVGTEDSSSRSAELNLFARYGLVMTGLVDDFVAFLLSDDFSSQRYFEWEAPRHGGPWLRKAVASILLGARGIAPRFSSLNNPSNGYTGNRFVYESLHPVADMLGTGILTAPRPHEAVGTCPVGIVMHKSNSHWPDESTFMQFKDIPEVTEAVMSNLLPRYAFTKTPPDSLAAIFFNKQRQGDNHVPATPYGPVLFVPALIDRTQMPHVQYWLHTDGAAIWTDEDPTPLLGAEAGALMRRLLAENEHYLPFRYQGDDVFFHTLRLAGEDFYRIYIIDPHWVDPRDCTLNIYSRIPGAIQFEDMMSGEALTSDGNSLELTVPAGSLRVIKAIPLYTNSLVLEQESLSIDEGGRASLRIKLAAAPANDLASVRMQVLGTVEEQAVFVCEPRTLTFNADNFHIWQAITITSPLDADTVDQMISVRFAATGLGIVDVPVRQNDNGMIPTRMRISSATDPLRIGEGETATFQVCLSKDPGVPIQVQVARLDGDADISIQQGTVLDFDSTNFDKKQTVVLAAVHDADAHDGIARFLLSSADAVDVEWLVQEEDDGRRLLFDCGLAEYPTPGHWNNLERGIDLSDAIDDSGISTGVAVRFPADAGFSATRSHFSNEAYEHSAYQDGFRIAAGQTARLQFGHLIPGQSYDVSLVAADTTDSNSTQFDVANVLFDSAQQEFYFRSGDNIASKSVLGPLKPELSRIDLDFEAFWGNLHPVLGVIEVTWHDGASNRRVLIDLGASERQMAGNWNNITTLTIGEKITNLIDENGMATGISIHIDDDFLFISGQDDSIEDEGVVLNAEWPANAIIDGFQLEGSRLGTNDTAGIYLDGLDNGRTYTITCTGSSTLRRSGVTEDGAQLYVRSDNDLYNDSGLSAVRNSGLNIYGQKNTFSSLLADDSGFIHVDVSAVAGSPFAVLNLAELAWNDGVDHSIIVDLGPVDGQTVAGFHNNLHDVSGGSNLNACVEVDGTVTAVSCGVVGGASFDSAVATFPALHPYPASAHFDGFRTQGQAAIEFTGLAPSNRYAVYLHGYVVGGNARSYYRADTAVAMQINTDNEDEIALLEDLMPAADGSLRINVERSMHPESAEGFISVVELRYEESVLLECNTSSLTISEGGSASFQVRLTEAPYAPLGVSFALSGDPDFSISNPEPLFTAENYDQWQTVTVAAGEDTDVLFGSATLTVILANGHQQSLALDETDNDTWLVYNNDNLTIDEGGYTEFQVKLSQAETEPITVTMMWQSGDSDMQVAIGSVVFQPDEWDSWKTFTIQANEDADTNNGTAFFSLKLVDGYDKQIIRVTERDNAVTVPIDFGSADAEPAVNWNAASVAASGKPAIELIDASGRLLGITGAAQTDFSSGSAATASSVLSWPAGVQDDYFSTASSSVWRIAGLQPGVRCDATFYGSRSTLSISNHARYQLGSKFVELDNSANTNGTIVSVSGAIVDENGNLDFTLRVANGADEAVINAMILRYEPEDEPLVDRSTLLVNENGTAQFGLRMRFPPAAPVTVQVEILPDGDASLTRISPATVLFHADNFSQWQWVEIAAADDLDEINGQATVRCSVGTRQVEVLLTEEDDDVATLGIYHFAGATSSERTPHDEATAADGTVFSPAREQDVSISGGTAEYLKVSEWNTASSRDDNAHFVSFPLTAATGSHLQIDGVRFVLNTNVASDPPSNYHYKLVVDGVEQASADITQAAGLVQEYRYDVTPFIVTAVQEAELRLYAWGAIDSGRRIGLDDVRLLGTVAVNSTSYNITATADSNGSISPSGVEAVLEGDDRSFVMVADESYLIADVMVDGVSQGNSGSYTFSNVASSHTISASFTKQTAERLGHYSFQTDDLGEDSDDARTPHDEGTAHPLMTYTSLQRQGVLSYRSFARAFASDWPSQSASIDTTQYISWTCDAAAAAKRIELTSMECELRHGNPTIPMSFRIEVRQSGSLVDSTDVSIGVGLGYVVQTFDFNDIIWSGNASVEFRVYAWNSERDLSYFGIDDIIIWGHAIGNSAPLINGQRALTIVEDTALTLSLSDVTSSDVDGDAMSLKVHAGNNYTVAGSTITPTNNFIGQLTVPIQVNDGALDSPMYNAVVTVTPVNDVPVNLSIPSLSGTFVSGEVLTANPGSWWDDSNDTLSYHYVWQHANTDTGTTTMNLSSSSSQYTLTNVQAGKWIRVQVTVSDGGGLSTTKASSWYAVSSTSVTTYTVHFTRNDSSGGSLNGSTTQQIEHGSDCSAVTAVPATGYQFMGWSGSVSGTTNPLTITNVIADMTITALFEPEPLAYTLTVQNGSGDGIYVFGSRIEVHADTAVSGSHFTGWTMNGGSVIDIMATTTMFTMPSAHVLLTATYANDAPVITQTGPLLINMDEDGSPTAWVAPSVDATDSGGDVLAWSVHSPPRNGRASVGGIGASPTILQYTPTTDYSGSDSFTIAVNDGNGNSATLVLNVNIAAINDVPTVADGLSAQLIASGAELSYTFPESAFADVDGDSLTYKASGLPSWMSFDAVSRIFSGTADTDNVHTITVTASDGSTQVSTSFTVTVTSLSSYTLTVANGTGGGSYLAGTVMTIIADTPQAGQAFTSWTSSAGGHIADASVSSTTYTMPANDVIVTAIYTTNNYTVTYIAGTGGNITGLTPQTVAHGASGQAVTATAADGYIFRQWSDGETNATRTDTNIQADLSVSATFTPSGGGGNTPPTAATLSMSTVGEHQLAGTVVGMLSATDAESDPITYSLSGTAADNASFTLGGSAGAELQTASRFDYETKDSYIIEVSANDGQGGITASNFTITVIDENYAMDMSAIDLSVSITGGGTYSVTLDGSTISSDTTPVHMRIPHTGTGSTTHIIEAIDTANNRSATVTLTIDEVDGVIAVSN